MSPDHLANKNSASLVYKFKTLSNSKTLPIVVRFHLYKIIHFLVCYSTSFGIYIMMLFLIAYNVLNKSDYWKKASMKCGCFALFLLLHMFMTIIVQKIAETFMNSHLKGAMTSSNFFETDFYTEYKSHIIRIKEYVKEAYKMEHAVDALKMESMEETDINPLPGNSMEHNTPQSKDKPTDINLDYTLEDIKQKQLNQ